MFGVGRIADETRQAREIAKSTLAEVKSVHGKIESKVVSLMQHVDASTAHAIQVLMGRVQEVAAHSETQALLIAETVTRQLESEIQVDVMSTAATTETNCNVSLGPITLHQTRCNHIAIRYRYAFRLRNHLCQLEWTSSMTYN